jgi:hypothetical protein
MYEDLILERTTEDQYQLLDALDLYESFHYVRRETDWGKFSICMYLQVVPKVDDL